MCGCYVSPEQAAIEHDFHIGGRSNPNPFRGLFNAAPILMLPLVRVYPERGLELALLRWGLIPSGQRMPRSGRA
jgi:putative SOS response-associated peptidase YedK